MSERVYYVLCSDNCKFESMTKEQIYDAIAEATGATPTLVDQAFITQIKEQNAQASMKIWKGTEAQFNALASKAANTLYFIGTDEIRNYDEEIETLNAVRPINKGGTGATTGAAALSNLGIKDAFKVIAHTVVIASNMGIGHTQTSSIRMHDERTAGYKFIGIVGIDTVYPKLIATSFIPQSGEEGFDADITLYNAGENAISMGDIVYVFGLYVLE